MIPFSLIFPKEKNLPTMANQHHAQKPMAKKTAAHKNPRARSQGQQLSPVSTVIFVYTDE
jgi:hypothetical protein